MSTKVYMGEGGSKSPKTGLRNLWMAPIRPGKTILFLKLVYFTDVPTK